MSNTPAEAGNGPAPPPVRRLRILCVGDIVGSPGRRIFKRLVRQMREAGAVQAVVANAENAAGGNGLTRALAEELFESGADLLTLGDHTWDQKDMAGWIGAEKRVLRPANYPPRCPGRGWGLIATPIGALAVVNLLGRVFMNPVDCPFRTVDALLEGGIPRDVPVLVDFHAEATSEKIALGWYLDGRVAGVFGTHTHVQTSDERILPGATAYITDLGMTGSRRSVIGREVEPVLRRFTTGMPSRFEVAKQDVVLEGVVMTLDAHTGKALAIERVRRMEDDLSA